MLRKISRYILKMWGWKMAGVIPAEKKYVVVAAPHTSNWDFVIGQLYFMSAGIKASVMIKKELFYFPLGILLRALGGIPVDRQGKSDIVEQMIRQFELSDSFILTLTPEGTRKKVSEWKTGFHRIAAGANVPVLPGFFDYERKVVGVGDLFYPSEDADADMLKIKKFYKNIAPKHPGNFSVGDI
jgi:1-acyl-sn-glycerol-3-phosphate acyltransferase